MNDSILEGHLLIQSNQFVLFAIITDELISNLLAKEAYIGVIKGINQSLSIPMDQCPFFIIT